MMRESIIFRDAKMFLTGYVVLFLALLCAVTSTLYNYATAESPTEFLKNSVFLVFLNSLDEFLFSAIQRFSPKWIRNLQFVESDTKDLSDEEYGMTLKDTKCTV